MKAALTAGRAERGSASKPRTPQPKKRKNPVQRVELPERIHVTDDELAVITRLIRTMRQTDERGAYWLGPFIEFLLHLETNGPDLTFIDPEQAREAFCLIEAEGDPLLKPNSKFFKTVRKQFPALRFVSSTLPATCVLDGMPDDEEQQFYELLQLWRKDHPEPPQRPQFPKGHLGRKDDDE